MKRIHVAFALTAGAVLVLLLTVSMAYASGPVAQDTTLSTAPTADAYEIHADARGSVWVSDSGAGEIRQLNYATGVYTSYEGLPGATAAQMDAQGQVWWVNNNGNTLGRLSLGSDTGTTWNLPGAGNLLGLAIDQAGRIWVSDSTSSNLYSFDPASSSLCRRTLPDGGSSNYLAVHGSTLWLADWINGRIAGLDMTSNLLRYWTLPPKAFPVDLGADPGGNIWWADAGLGLLGRLEPGSGRLTHFPLPVGTQPGMLTVSPRMVWYTEERTATAGTLNPSIASSTSYMRTAVTSTLTPVCTPLVANGSAALLSHSAPIAWSPATITTTAPAAGWLIFQLPAGAQPRGIADAGDRVWVVEAGLKRLLSISIPRVYLPLVVRRS